MEQERLEADKELAAEWAREILKRDNVLILDTETTDLNGEIIELAMINLKGETVFNRRFNPLTPISEGAKAVHGISMEMVADEPFFIEEYETICELLTGAELVLIYNAAFDIARIRTTCNVQKLTTPKYNSDCIMTWYAQWCGEWSDYHGNYKWQPLNGGHNALGDCLAALDCIKEMAGL
jgi:DNA polymerase-3 subunit epsilon